MIDPLYTISGTVTTNEPGGGIAGASVQLKQGGANIGLSVSTGSDGTYTISNVPAGDYTIEVLLTGYAAKTIPAFTVSGNAAAKDLLLEKLVLTGRVSITGTASVGRTLRADTSSLGGSGDITYQWLRGTAEIPEAAGVTYIPAAADIGQILKVRVGRAGYSETIESPVTSAVVVFATPAQYRGMVRFSGGTISGNSSGGAFPSGRTVSLRAFKIAKYETTYELWKEVHDWATDSARGATIYTFANPGYEGHQEAGTSPGTGTTNERHGWLPAQKRARPVTYINWRDAVVWCNAYSEMSGLTPVYYTDTTYSTVLRFFINDNGVETAADSAVMRPGVDGYRLPTDAEWEYAARGGDPADTKTWGYIYAGSKTIGDVAWYSNNANSVGSLHKDYGVHPAGTRDANSKGLYDMSGNVWEWCWDWFDSIETGSVSNPTGPATGLLRVFRGGGWSYATTYCTVAYRNFIYPSSRSINLGFRVLCGN
jgi:formylglycine-generating enzyme required for sulfatase activity